MLTSWLEAWDTPGLGGSALSLHRRLKVALTLTSALPSAEPSLRPSQGVSVPLLRVFPFLFFSNSACYFIFKCFSLFNFLL